MSGMWLFVVGAVVTTLAVAGMGLLVWGAVLDGRYEREVQARSGAGPAPSKSVT